MQEKNSKNQSKCYNIEEIKNKIKNELNEACEELHILVDKYLLPQSGDIEGKVFYWKLKADFYRSK